jgi:hypothetical protein
MKSERSYQLQDKDYDSMSYDESINSGSVQSIDEYSLTLKKAEIAAAAKIACAYLGIQKQITVDRDISDAEILKYQDELTNF